MTVDEIRERIADIIRQDGDDEVQHSMEDGLHYAVLEAIAAGSPDAAALAREALLTAEIDFARWCA